MLAVAHWKLYVGVFIMNKKSFSILVCFITSISTFHMHILAFETGPIYAVMIPFNKLLIARTLSITWSNEPAHEIMVLIT